MSDRRTLLERLADPQVERTVRVNRGALADSVISNVQRILNSRRGSARTVDEYGLPELSEVVHSFPEAIAELSRAIKECIERYEPRLRNVRVTHVPDEIDILTLRFHIAAQLVIEGEEARIAFDSTIAPSGRATVRL